MGCVGEMTAIFPVKGATFEFIGRFTGSYPGPLRDYSADRKCDDR